MIRFVYKPFPELCPFRFSFKITASSLRLLIDGFLAVTDRAETGSCFRGLE